MSAAEEKAKVRTKSAIKVHEEEVDIQVTGSAALVQVFHQVYLAYLIRATLGDMTFGPYAAARIKGDSPAVLLRIMGIECVGCARVE